MAVSSDGCPPRRRLLPRILSFDGADIKPLKPSASALTLSELETKLQSTRREWRHSYRRRRLNHRQRLEKLAQHVDLLQQRFAKPRDYLLPLPSADLKG